MIKKKNGTLLLCVIAALFLIACGGDDGAAGPAGPAGPAGESGDNAEQQSIALTFLARARNPDSGFDE